MHTPPPLDTRLVMEVGSQLTMSLTVAPHKATWAGSPSPFRIHDDIGGEMKAIVYSWFPTTMGNYLLEFKTSTDAPVQTGWAFRR